MIDPIHSLAFSIQANPGVYAVLIGSGVSRAANILTGWDITLDLIRQLAELHEEKNDLDPLNWYQQKFEKEANYSDLLDALVTTPAERQQLLRPYFEANDAEREQGEKEPTAAHRAIAVLAVQGFIKVIITTNFDRLIETALEEAGIEGLTVISSPDQVQGALPLIHTRCCVFKVHGDYRDTRIRNTPAELDEYPPEFDEFLDRIFDEFGLIVCGWSAKWDGALRSAISRAKSRRFTTYWAMRSEPDDQAQKLIKHRRAQEIRIADADTFFQTVQQHVESIETFSRPHPLSTEAAVASLKRYLAEPRYRIQLSDLIKDTVERVVEITSGKAFSVHSPDFTTESARERLHRYETACEPLLAMALVGGCWAEEEHYPMWQEALQHLDLRTLSGGSIFWLDLQRYPATLLLYALGLGAIKANLLQLLSRTLTAPLYKDQREDISAVQVLPPSLLFHPSTDPAKNELARNVLRGIDGHQTLNGRIHDILRPYAKRIILDTNRYTMTFDKLEILMALSYIHQRPRDRDYPPPGLFLSRDENRIRILQEIKESLSTKQNESPFVTSGIFGETVADCEQGLAHLEQLVETGRWY